MRNNKQKAQKRADEEGQPYVIFDCVIDNRTQLDLFCREENFVRQKYHRNIEKIEPKPIDEPPKTG